jgi:hypothetical protein
LLLLFYLIGIAICFTTSKLRANKHVLGLLIIATFTFLFLTFLERNRWYIYLVYVIPLLCVISCAAFYHLAAKLTMLRVGTSLIACLMLAFSVTTIWFRSVRSADKAVFEPTANYVLARAKGDSQIIAPGEFGIILGYEKVKDDPYFEYVGNDVQYIVISEIWDGYYQSTTASKRKHIEMVLRNYTEIFETGIDGRYYRVLERR